MKIVAVHGEDTLRSRARFMQIVKGVKKKGWEVIHLDPKSDFETQLTNRSLFEDNNLYIVEDFSKLTSLKTDWLKNNQEKFDSQLLLYSKKNINLNSLKKISKNVKSEKFDVKNQVFKFADSLIPGNSENALKLFREIIKNGEPIELLVALIAKNFRDMFWILHGGVGLSYPDWRIKKLKSAANKFTKKELGDIISTLADIDYKSKTTDVNASLLLEMLIVEKLS